MKVFLDQHWTGLGLAVGLLAALLLTHGAPTPAVLAQATEPILVVPHAEPGDTRSVIFFITDDRQTVLPGEEVTYRITVRNQRPEELRNVQITQHIPDFVIPIATLPATEANADNRTLIWRNQTLPSGVERIYAIQSRVAPAAPAGINLRSTAEIRDATFGGSSTDQTIVARLPSTTPIVAPNNVHTTARTGPGSVAFLAAVTLAGGTWSVHNYAKLRANKG